MDNILDVYDLMDSIEIREYLRKQNAFPPLQQASVIIQSYYSVEDKIFMLRQLAMQASGDEKKVIEKSSDILEEALEELYHPKEKRFYWIEREYLDGNSVILGNALENEILEIYSSFEEVLAEALKREAVFFDVETGNNLEGFEIFRLDLAYISGRLQIWHLYVPVEWYKDNELENIVSYLINGRFEYEYSLPFASGSRVKIQTLYMDKAIYGYLNSGSGYWHRFIEDYASDLRSPLYIDLSNGIVDAWGSDKFSVFDCLMSAEEDEKQ